MGSSIDNPVYEPFVVGLKRWFNFDDILNQDIYLYILIYSAAISLKVLMKSSDGFILASNSAESTNIMSF